MKRTGEYRAGYAAGYTARSRVPETASRFDRFYAAAMTGILAAPSRWERGGKSDTTPEDYAETAKAIARAMVAVKP